MATHEASEQTAITIRVRKFITQNLSSSPRRLLLAVSGGVDSIVLLHVLLQLRQELRLTMHVVTVDHQMRGEQSDRDARFVADTCEQWDVACTVRRADVPQLAAQERGNSEAVARRERYRILTEVAQQHGILHVVTAHHADDQAETIMMRIVRGTSLHGLQGMQPVSSVPAAPSILLLRPLLSIDRSRIEQYGRAQNLVWHEDASNRDTSLLRNVVRAELVPWLKQRNPQAVAAINRLASAATIQNDFVHTAFLRDVWPHTIVAPDVLLADRQLFTSLHPAMQYEWLIMCLTHLKGSHPAIEQHQLEGAIMFAQNGRHGQEYPFSDGYRIRIEYDQLQVSADDYTATQRFSLQPDQQVELSLNRLVTVDAAEPWLAGLFDDIDTMRHACIPCLVRQNDNQTESSVETASVLYTAIRVTSPNSTVLRTRQMGDVIQPAGRRTIHRALRRWMIDQKIPRAIRDNMPLLVIDGDIVAIVERTSIHVCAPYQVDYQSIHKEAGESKILFSMETVGDIKSDAAKHAEQHLTEQVKHMWFVMVSIQPVNS